MRKSDEVVERVMAGLRDADASLGLEDRILESLEMRAKAHKPAAPRWAWGVAMASVIVVGLFMTTTLIHRQGSDSTQATQQAVAPLTHAPAKPTADQNATLPPNPPVAQVGKRVRSAEPARKVRRMSAADAVLLAEMRAPSHPAPEAPLTEQEKLLIRVVHLGDPQIMAMLNPELRAMQEAESEAEFQEFAGQSGKGDSE